MPNSSLTISRVAKLSGLGIETLRYYQRIGLIAEPPKPAQGYRVYDPTILEQLKFIQRAKQLGFTLAEIQELFALDASACDQTREIAQHKLELIRQKIAALQAMAHELEQLVDACQKDAAHTGCPIIKSLCDQ